ncbi:hypothetical protein CPB84DRAFT_1778704 [Gymnopilus junonius]|uniref:DUF6533 domain-containing protein n=1 Tax=Gymnopilus junonius TaxID=109634 RepID=A0A9P5NNX3_GYMJU|nr:hypothetical protein CPB84DRAFT_1778704 [Gymnopilus junonius]
MDETDLWRVSALGEEVFARNICSLAGLVWLIWEYVVTWHNEYRYIWGGSMNRVKYIYLFSRYFAIAAQVVNTCLVFFPLSRLPVGRRECEAWLLFMIVSACLLMLAVDIVIMLRVYALYNCSLRIALFLAFLLLGQIAVATTCTALTIPKTPFGPTCDVLKTPLDAAYIMAAAIFSQTVLLILTVRKRKVAFGQSPVVDLVVRDGAWVFALIVSMFVVIIPYLLVAQVAKPYVILVLPLSLLSIMACRLILNMQKVVVIPANYSGDGMTDTGIAFTSYIDFPEDESRIPSRASHLTSIITTGSIP